MFPKACSVAKLVTVDGNEISTDIFSNSDELNKLPSLCVEAVT